MTRDRWELGSSFHWPELEAPSVDTETPWSEESLHLGSGRDALVLLLEHGKATRGWRRLRVPGYMCQEVMVAAASSVELRTYRFDVRSNTVDTDWDDMEAGDAVLVVNMFGRGRATGLPVPDGVDVIEDHTHDPWSRWAHESEAPYAFASLRKTLPVATGAVAWSPRHLDLPDQPAVTDGRSRASSTGFQAMLLKSLYLRGHDIGKAAFREIALSSENATAFGPPSGMPNADRALLPVFPVERWRKERRDNGRHLTGRLSALEGIECLDSDSQDSTPFSVVVTVSSHFLREQLREHLTRHRVYPSVLWSLEEPTTGPATADDLALSRRMLSIHCDWRYDIGDMDRVFAVVASALGSD